jgi:hypothetical protein
MQRVNDSDGHRYCVARHLSVRNGERFTSDQSNVRTCSNWAKPLFFRPKIVG